jgi:hypothetical protein
MKALLVIMIAFAGSFSLTACEKEKPLTDDATPAAGTVSGKVTDAQGNPLSGVKIILEHTVWAATYVFATSDANGNYEAELPAVPAGSWTAKAQITKIAYANEYKFDLAVDDNTAFTVSQKTVRNFTWKLSGAKEDGTGYYGAHVDVYQWGTDVPMDEIKLLFTRFDASSRLVDGSPIQAIERQVEDVAGTFMVKDVPVGHYSVKAVYPGKTLLLKNRHNEEQAEQSKEVVFGKHGYRGETEYNIEFWLSE